MTETYSIEKKKKLAERIQRLTVESDLKQIKNIIFTNNPSLDVTKNKNGYFMQFQNLSYETYVEIEKYINKADTRKLKEIESEILQSSEYVDEISDEKGKKKSKKLRLTNTENHILNRVKYEKELEKNEGCEKEVSYYTDVIKKPDIFIKTTDRTKKINELFV
jgi:hypothetical protein